MKNITLISSSCELHPSEVCVTGISIIHECFTGEVWSHGIQNCISGHNRTADSGFPDNRKYGWTATRGNLNRFWSKWSWDLPYEHLGNTWQSDGFRYGRSYATGVFCSAGNVPPVSQKVRLYHLVEPVVPDWGRRGQKFQRDSDPE